MDIEADLRSMMSDMAWKEVMDMAFRVMKEMFANSPNPPTSLEAVGVALELLGETFPEIPNHPSSPEELDTAKPVRFSAPHNPPPSVSTRTLRPRRYRVPSEGAAPFSSVQPFKVPAVPSCLHLNKKVPAVGLPRVMFERLVPVGFVNTEAGIQSNTALPTDPDTATDPPPYTRFSQRRKHEHDYSQPYIKKPPNAFMIFRKEQRPVVVVELQNGDSASVNTILGQRWKALSKEQQAKYYNQSEMERQFHNQLHPEWSTSKNYGKKRKRLRRNVPNWT